MAAPLSHTEWCPPLAFFGRVINFLSRPVFFHFYCLRKGSPGFALGIYDLKRLGSPNSRIELLRLLLLNFYVNAEASLLISLLIEVEGYDAFDFHRHA